MAAMATTTTIAYLDHLTDPNLAIEPPSLADGAIEHLNIVRCCCGGGGDQQQDDTAQQQQQTAWHGRHLYSTNNIAQQQRLTDHNNSKGTARAKGTSTTHCQVRLLRAVVRQEDRHAYVFSYALASLFVSWTGPGVLLRDKKTAEIRKKGFCCHCYGVFVHSSTSDTTTTKTTTTPTLTVPSSSVPV